MKLIAVTQRLVNAEGYPQIRDVLDMSWAELFESIGFLPILLPTQFDFKKYFRTLKISGILLTGGNDLGCVSGDELSLMRDKFEKQLIRYAISHKIPVFGVCRGMQIIADYFGAGLKKTPGHVRVHHKLIVKSESKFKKPLKSLKTVNSFHRYAITGLPGELIVSATSADGAIEAIEHKTYRIFGQMWHPEREKPFRKVQLDFMRRFFK